MKGKQRGWPGPQQGWERKRQGTEMILLHVIELKTNIKQAVSQPLTGRKEKGEDRALGTLGLRN